MRKDNISLRGLFKRVFKGKATAYEQTLADDWFRQLDLTSRNDMVEKSDEQLKERMLTVILKKIEQRPTPVYRRLVWLRVAGALLLLGTIGWLIYQQASDGRHFYQVASTAVAKQVELPDGSVVWLNAYSSISWDETYGQRERRVCLNGEAYFDVKKSAQIPFQVEMGALQTTVLGTTFNAEYLAKERVTRVALVTGLVQLNLRNESGEVHRLYPGETMLFDRYHNRFERKQSAVADPAAWIDGGLVFNEIPLKDALDRLAKRYQLTIHYDLNRVRDKTVTATLPRLEASEALNAVLFAHGMQYTQLKQGGIMVN